MIVRDPEPGSKKYQSSTLVIIGVPIRFRLRVGLSRGGNLEAASNATPVV